MCITKYHPKTYFTKNKYFKSENNIIGLVFYLFICFYSSVTYEAGPPGSGRAVMITLKNRRHKAKHPVNKSLELPKTEIRSFASL